MEFDFGTVDAVAIGKLPHLNLRSLKRTATFPGRDRAGTELEK